MEGLGVGTFLCRVRRSFEGIGSLFFRSSWTWIAEIELQLELAATFAVQLDLRLLKSLLSWTWHGLADAPV